MSELHRKKGMGPRVDINNDNNDDQMSGHPSRVNESPNHNKKVHVDGPKNNSQQFHQFRGNKILKYSGSKSTPVLEKVFKIPPSKIVAPAPADLLYKKGSFDFKSEKPKNQKNYKKNNYEHLADNPHNRAANKDNPTNMVQYNKKDKVLKGTTPGHFSMPERIQA